MAQPQQRKDVLEALEKVRNSRVICYVTGDRGKQETQIGDDVLPFVAEHLGGRRAARPKIELVRAR